MTAHLQILVYGLDAMLLQTRLWLLQGAGYSVFTASSLDEVRKILSSQQIHLLILCHSLSSKDCIAAATIVRATGLHTRTLQIETLGRAFARDHSDFVVNGAAGPRAFLAAVRETQAQANPRSM